MSEGLDRPSMAPGPDGRVDSSVKIDWPEIDDRIGLSDGNEL